DEDRDVLLDHLTDLDRHRVVRVDAGRPPGARCERGGRDQEDKRRDARMEFHGSPLSFCSSGPHRLPVSCASCAIDRNQSVRAWVSWARALARALSAVRTSRMLPTPALYRAETTSNDCCALCRRSRDVCTRCVAVFWL